MAEEEKTFYDGQWRTKAGEVAAAPTEAVPQQVAHLADVLLTPDPKAAPTVADSILLTDAADGGAIKKATIADILKLVIASSGTTGNPYIDAPLTPDPWSDDFVSGTPDLGARGFAVHNWNDNVPMTRIGDVTGAPTAALAPNQYRSTRYSSTLLCQFPAGRAIHIVKPCTGSHMFAARLGVPMINGSWGGLFLTTATQAPWSSSAHWTGDGPGWTMCYIDAGPSVRYLGRMPNASSYIDVHMTNNVNFTLSLDTFIVNHNEGAQPSQYGSFVHAPTMQIRGTSINNPARISGQNDNNGAALMAAPLGAAGFALHSGPSATEGGTGIIALDYVRRMPVNSWLGAV